MLGIWYFYMIIPCDKTFSLVPLFFTLWPWPSCFTHFLTTLTLLITFEQWVLELWYFTWVFLVIRPFSEYHYFWHWPWPCSLTHFLKTLNFLMIFEQWVLELWYFTGVFLVIRPFFFYPVTLTFEFDLLFSNINFANNFWIVSARALIFYMSIPCDNTFSLVPLFLCPRDQRSGAYCFCPVCHSVIL